MDVSTFLTIASGKWVSEVKIDRLGWGQGCKAATTDQLWFQTGTHLNNAAVLIWMSGLLPECFSSDPAPGPHLFVLMLQKTRLLIRVLAGVVFLWIFMLSVTRYSHFVKFVGKLKWVWLLARDFVGEALLWIWMWLTKCAHQSPYSPISSLKYCHFHHLLTFHGLTLPPGLCLWISLEAKPPGPPIGSHSCARHELSVLVPFLFGLQHCSRIQTYPKFVLTPNFFLLAFLLGSVLGCQGIG